MPSPNQTVPGPRKTLWTGRIISGLVALFLLFDGLTQVMKVAPARTPGRPRTED